MVAFGNVEDAGREIGVVEEAGDGEVKPDVIKKTWICGADAFDGGGVGNEKALAIICEQVLD